MYHNGTWDAQKGKVTWKTTVREGDNAKIQLPAVFWAVWSKPDEAFQKKHFGRLVLSADKLVEYCIWHAGLTEAEAKPWDALIASLKPGDDLEAKGEKAFKGVVATEASTMHYAAGVKLLTPEAKEGEK